MTSSLSPGDLEQLGEAALVDIRDAGEHLGEDVVDIALQLLRHARAHEGVLALRRRDEQDIDHLAIDPDRLDRIAAARHGSRGQLLAVHLPAGIQRNALDDHALAGHVGVRQHAVLDEHLDQRLAQHGQAARALIVHLHVQHRDVVVQDLVELRRKAAGHDAGLGGDGVLDQARVKAHAGVVDEVLVGPADAGQASVLVHAHQVVGVEIILAVDPLQLEEHLVPQLAGAHRRGAQQQHAGARAFGDVVIAVLVLHQDLRLEARQQEADGVVLPVRGAEQARAAQLGQPVAVDDAGGGAAGPQVVVELLLEFGGHVGAAHEHDLQLGKVDVGHGLEPGVQYALAGEQHVDPVVLDRLGIARVGGAARAG